MNVFDKMAEKIMLFFSSISTGLGGYVSGAPETPDVASELEITSGVLSVFFITVILYSLVRIYEIRRDEKKKLHLADLF